MIAGAVDWLRRTDPKRPWLIFGKGPSFDKRTKLDLTKYKTFGLNHVVLLQPVDVAHYSDLDAFLACRDVLPGVSTKVVMPWHPHIDNKPGKRNLLELAKAIPLLGSLSSQERLLSYNSTLSRAKNPSLQTVKVRYFSAVAAVNLLAAAEAKEIYSLGIDGGSSYAKGFARSDLLANGRPSFDVQFREIRATAKKHKIKYQSLAQIL